jgi:hypothetical protein
MVGLFAMKALHNSLPQLPIDLTPSCIFIFTPKTSSFLYRRRGAIGEKLVFTSIIGPSKESYDTNS